MSQSSSTQSPSSPNPTPPRKLLRPSAQELEKTSLRATPNGSLVKKSAPLGESLHVRSNSLQQLLSNRMSKESLIASNVLPSSETSSSSAIQSQARKLAQQKRRDSLSGLLSQRLSIEALAERNVYKPVVEGAEHADGDSSTIFVPQVPEDSFAQQFINVPHRIEGLKDIVQVACGWSHSLALTRDGQVYSWGSNLNGRLGRPVDQKRVQKDDDDDSTSPSEKSPISPPERPKRSFLDPEAPPAEKKVEIDHCAQPTLIPGLRNCRKIACGDHHNAALCADGLYVWGRNEFGALGLGHRDDVHAPTLADVSVIINALGLPDNAHVEDVALGANHTVVVIHGKALAAGWNKGNRLGLVSTRHFLRYSLYSDDSHQDATAISRFQPIKGLSAPMRSGTSSLNIRTVAAGDVMTIAIAEFNSNQLPNHNNVFLWGTSMHSSPYPIIELNGIQTKSVCMGSNFSVLLTGHGEVYCFGSNRDYQLGRPASSDLSSFHAPGPLIVDRQFTDADGSPFFISIASGKYHGLALDKRGRLFGWGLNKQGILGVGSDLPSLPPTLCDVTKILDEHSKQLFATEKDALEVNFKFVHVDGGASHTLVVDNAGYVYAIGSFRNGKLGL